MMCVFWQNLHPPQVSLKHTPEDSATYINLREFGIYTLGQEACIKPLARPGALTNRLYHLANPVGGKIKAEM